MHRIHTAWKRSQIERIAETTDGIRGGFFGFTFGLLVPFLQFSGIFLAILGFGFIINFARGVNLNSIDHLLLVGFPSICSSMIGALFWSARSAKIVVQAERLGKRLPFHLQRAMLIGGLIALAGSMLLLESVLLPEKTAILDQFRFLLVLPAILLVGAEMGLLDAILMKNHFKN